MKKKIVSVVLMAFALSSAKAESLKGVVSAGANIQGASLRWFPFGKMSLEARGYAGSGVRLLGLRASRHFLTSSRFIPYASLEGGVCDFDDELLRGGTGAFSGVFLGVERFQGRRFSLQFEAGAAYVSVNGTPVGTSDIKSNGVEFVANAQVNFHLRRPRTK